MKSVREVTELIEQQLARISQVELVECIRPLLVTPRLEHRAWDYGQPDQTFPCWIALEHKPSQTAVAYCEEGFGPTHPWGLLFIDSRASMGMDSQWFVSLEEAVRDSSAWSGPNPVGYEAQ